MNYTLDDFCADGRAALRSEVPLERRLAQMADNLARLLANPAFVQATFKDDTSPGQQLLHHDPDTDFYVLAHVQRPGKRGAPHSHGDSWAIYGNARGCTKMTEYRRVAGSDEDGLVLEVATEYRLESGQTRAYGPGLIHSTEHPDGAWVIRVTGTDLNAIPRFHFRPQCDKLLERA
jgi:predicted metal-dependent enzyme (double-stranded beta helix superfamily)